MNQEDGGKIDNLNKSLYSRVAPDIRTKRRLRFHEQENTVKTDWEHENAIPEQVELTKQYKSTSMSFFTKILMWSFVFFLLSLGVGAYLVFRGSNIVSAKNVDIIINGPISVSGGEPISFDVQVSNQNNIKLETVDLSVDFPTGTTDITDSSKELKNFRELMDDIAPGGIEQKTIKAIVYGEENTKKEIKVSIEYRVKGSNAVFQKEKIFDLLISSSPITLSISSIKEVTAGQEFELTATINSNSKEVIKNLLLKAHYPFGFTYISSDIKPSSDNTLWKIGDMPANSKKTIKIKGKLEGQDDEVRVFRFSAGSASLKNDKTIGAEYISASHDISIKKPFISIGVSLDGNSENQEYIAKFNEPVRVEILYFNNLSTPVLNGEIQVKFSGSAFDKVSVSPNDGLYKSADNEIVWNSITNKELSTIEAGGTGRVGFNITPRDGSTSLRYITNPNIKMNISVSGKRISETDVPETLSSTAIRTIKIPSSISLGGQITRSIGPFTNTGPIPPRVEQNTSYTVIWTVDNTSSSLSNAYMESSLPAYVKWLGTISPGNEDINYNSVSGEIVWNVGNVGTYTIGNSKRRQVAFQISLNPNITQVDQVPILINQSSFSAQDDFTGETLKSNLGSLTTVFVDDPSFKSGDEKVVK